MQVVMASPPKPGVGVPPTILFAAHLAGADMVLALGGVQAHSVAISGALDSSRVSQAILEQFEPLSSATLP